MPLQHQREAPLHFLRRRADGDGAGHVGRAVAILPAGIDQVETAALDRPVRLLLHAVMHHRAIRPGAGNGVEGQVLQQPGLLAERLQPGRRAQFVDTAPGASAAIQCRKRDKAAPSRACAALWPAISMGFLTALGSTAGSRSAKICAPPASSASNMAATARSGSAATVLPAKPASASAKAERSCTRTALPRCFATASSIFSGATYRSAVASAWTMA